MPTFREARAQDAVSLASTLRAADRSECEAFAGPGHEGVLVLHSLTTAEIAMTILGDDGEPIGAFGVTDSGIPNVGIVWLFGSDRMVRHKVSLMRQCRPYLDRFHELYPALTNVVHIDNKVHIRWLRSLGFKRLGTVQMGPRKSTFIEFGRMKT